MAVTQPVRHFDHLTERDRWVAVRGCTELGLNRAVVATQIGCSVRTVGRVLSLFRETGDVREEHGGGRPHGYNKRQMQRLSALIRDNSNATAAGLIALMGPQAPQISEQTMRQYRRDLGFTRRREGIALYDTPQQVEKRHRWALQHRGDDILSWLFMDESTMVLRHTGAIAWVKRGDPTPPHFVDSIVAAVHMWGVAWEESSSFAQYYGHLRSRGMFNLLEDNLAPYAPDLPGRTVVQDGATWHWTKEVRGWYDDAGLIPLRLPAKSPRFNAIERCWGWIKKHVRAARPHNQASLVQALTNACQAIPIRIICGYIRETRKNIRSG